MNGRNTTPTPIIDKNGRQTTVHKNAQPADMQGRIDKLNGLMREGVTVPRMFTSGVDAQAYVKSIADDSPILTSRVAAWREVFTPDEDDEVQNVSGIEARSADYAKVDLMNDITSHLANIFGTHGMDSQHWELAGQFIDEHKNEVFGRGNSMTDAIDEFLGLDY